MEVHKSARRAVVITGGYCACERIDRHIFDGAFVIAADSGYEHARTLGIRPDILIGDMDSLREIPKDIRQIRASPEKNETDTMLAGEYAAARGARELVIIGGMGGRADHLLSNLFYLEDLCRRGIRASLTDGENTIRMVSDETIHISNRGGYFSLLAVDECIVSVVGCKYPLHDAHLRRAWPYAVSNEVIGADATLTVKGLLFMIESRK